MKVVISDLDGTIALIEHRRHYVEEKNKDWDMFFKACINDEPNKPVIEILNILSLEGYVVIIVSGRSVDVREKTEDWLKENKVLYDYLYMRPANDYTPDDILKRKMLENIKKELDFKDNDILCIFDDREKVVNMWRESGYPCFQVAEGKF